MPQNVKLKGTYSPGNFDEGQQSEERLLKRTTTAERQFWCENDSQLKLIRVKTNCGKTTKLEVTRYLHTVVKAETLVTQGALVRFVVGVNSALVMIQSRRCRKGFV